LFDQSFGLLREKDLGDSAVADAARLFLCSEFGVPYYAGSLTLARLASRNVEQLLALGGDMFEEILGSLTLAERPFLNSTRQDAIVKVASRDMWQSIPRRAASGRDVQTLLISIAGMARRETYRPTAPYAPGVTGTALSMQDREMLLRPETRQQFEGAERLLAALGSAVANNLLEADVDRSVKGKHWMVLYLNRLLCPQFGLPLRRGGFREQPLKTMARWLARPMPTLEAEPQQTIL